MGLLSYTGSRGEVGVEERLGGEMVCCKKEDFCGSPRCRMGLGEVVAAKGAGLSGGNRKSEKGSVWSLFCKKKPLSLDSL
jgi:hypothetical protein